MDKILDLLFPKFCLGCQKEGLYLCDDCRALLNICDINYCLCGVEGVSKPLPLLKISESGKCEKCEADPKNSALSGLYFALPFKETGIPGVITKKLIYQFKYSPYLKDLAKTFASILAEHFIKTGKNTDKIWEGAVLVPVPLDKKKLKNRGYNQSEELAKELAKILKIPVVADILIKTKPTASQAGLKKEEREKNLQDAFAIKQAETGSPLISGKKVFLVDDVFTTGSTMKECARVLQGPINGYPGAKSVWGICIARDS